MRILLVGLPRMLCELIAATIAEQPDLELVDPIDDGAHALAVLEQGRADVVVAGPAAIDPSAVAAVLRVRPDARVLCVSADGRNTSLWELRPHEERLGDVSPERLLEAIRGERSVQTLK